MEHESFWDEELPSENDDRVAKIEAEIAEEKAILAKLSGEEL